MAELAALANVASCTADIETGGRVRRAARRCHRSSHSRTRSRRPPSLRCLIAIPPGPDKVLSRPLSQH